MPETDRVRELYSGFLPLVLILFFLASEALAAPPGKLETLDFCLPVSMAQRTGSASCWIRYAIGPEQSLCLPERRWFSVLEAREPVTCASWKGQWRFYSPPENQLSERKAKKVFSVFSTRDFLPRNPGSFSSFRTALRWMETVRENTARLIQPSDPSGALRHLVIGQSKPGGQTDFLRRIGFLHLLTLSGIHLYALMGWLGVLFPRFFSLIGVPVGPGLWLSRFFIGATWLWAWLLSGARPGMLRPWLLILFGQSALVLGFRWRLWAPLLIALLLNFGWSMIHGKSFHLGRMIYLLAVGGFILGRSQGRNAAARARAAVHFLSAYSSWIFVALFEAWQDGIVSIATPLVNLLSVFFLTTISYPGLLLGVLLREMGIRPWAEALVSIICRLTTLGLERIAFLILKLEAVWVIGRPALIAGVFLGSLLVFLPRRFLKIGLGTALFLAIVFRILTLTRPPSAETLPLARSVEQLDVGQGDAALVEEESRSPDRFGLIDSGAPGAISPLGWFQIFSARDATKLSWIGLTHLDRDHSGGALLLSRILPIGCIGTAKGELETPRGENYVRNLKELGVRVRNWDTPCVPFPLYDPPGRAGKKRAKKNSNMSAFLIPIGNEAFYLSAGDADSSDEKEIQKWALRRMSAEKGFRKTRILKLSHHGSKHSSSSEFLNAISPQEFWLSVGAGNLYGHPHPETLERVEKLGVPLLRTDRQGSLKYPRGKLKQQSSAIHDKDVSGHP